MKTIENTWDKKDLYSDIPQEPPQLWQPSKKALWKAEFQKSIKVSILNDPQIRPVIVLQWAKCPWRKRDITMHHTNPPSERNIHLFLNGKRGSNLIRKGTPIRIGLNNVVRKVCETETETEGDQLWEEKHIPMIPSFLDLEPKSIDCVIRKLIKSILCGKNTNFLKQIFSSFR